MNDAELTSGTPPPDTPVPNDIEEGLRLWCGALLVGAPARSPDQMGPRAVRSFVDRHGVGPLIAGKTRSSGIVRDAFAGNGSEKAAVAVEMARQAEFVSVVAVLQAQIPAAEPVVFKGQALAYQVYENPWLRPRGDIDALIDRDRFDAIVDLLQQCGYERETAFDGGLVLKQETLAKHQHGTSHAWDLHWSISNRPAFEDFLTYADLFESGERIPVGDVSFVAPNKIHGLLLACLHLVGHHANDIRMIWLYDIHLLAHALSDSRVEDFLDAAGRRTEVRAACHAALATTQRYMPTARMQALARSLDPGPGSRVRLGERRMARLWADARAVGRGNRLQWMRQNVFPSRSYMMRRFGIRRGWQLPFWYGIRILRAVPKLFRRR